MSIEDDINMLKQAMIEAQNRAALQFPESLVFLVSGAEMGTVLIWGAEPMRHGAPN